MKTIKLFSEIDGGYLKEIATVHVDEDKNDFDLANKLYDLIANEYTVCDECGDHFGPGLCENEIRWVPNCYCDKCFAVIDHDAIKIQHGVQGK